MLVTTIETALELKEGMANVNRDYYSDEAYEIMIDFYNECEDNVTFDPISISCEWYEEKLDYIIEQYCQLDTFDNVHVNNVDEVLEALSYYTTAYKTSEDTILYIVF